MIRHIVQTEVVPRFSNTLSFRKGDGSVLSEVDLMAQTAFAATLLLPIGRLMLGEEMTAQQQADLWRSHSDGLWIADLIDGTDSFINGLPRFAVPVAYVRHGCAQLGAIYNFVSDECFYTERDRDALPSGAPLPLRLASKKLNEAIALFLVHIPEPTRHS